VNWTPKIIATLAVAAGVVVVAIWLGGFDKPSAPQPLPPPPDREIQAAKTNPGRFFTPRSRPRSGKTNSAAVSVFVTGTNQIVDWEETIDAVLHPEGEPGAKAKALLALFPRFPEAGQVDAAQHIANLLADADYEALGRYFVNTNTSIAVQDVIMANLLGRPNSLKLPLLLEAARTPGNAKANDAKELLELYLEKDHGEDWEAWQKNMAEWLKENPD
jgi:hypothetical protein